MTNKYIPVLAGQIWQYGGINPGDGQNTWLLTKIDQASATLLSGNGRGPVLMFVLMYSTVSNHIGAELNLYELDFRRQLQPPCMWSLLE